MSRHLIRPSWQPLETQAARTIHHSSFLDDMFRAFFSSRLSPISGAGRWGEGGVMEGGRGYGLSPLTYHETLLSKKGKDVYFSSPRPWGLEPAP